jgi:acyl dehydratase
MSMDLHATSEPVGQFWEDMVPGEGFWTAKRTVTEFDLVNFVTTVGIIEPLFMDAGYAIRQGYGGRLVPAALSYSLAEGLVVQCNRFSGTAVAFLGMELDVHKPVFVGDTLHVHVVNVSAKETSSGGRGIVTTRNEVFKQGDECVLTYSPKRLIRGRG